MIAVIFSAAMSAISGEINSLATVTVIDIYKRHFRKKATTGIICGPRGLLRCSGESMRLCLRGAAAGLGR